MNTSLPDTIRRVRNFIISGTNYWNPGDDFVRDGVIEVLHQTFPGDLLNFHFYNFAEDQFPKSKFRGIGNDVSVGDLELCREFIDGVIIAGLSAGHEIKDLYTWVIANGLEERVFLIGAGYENAYCGEHVLAEPEATIFRKARIIIGRTANYPGFIKEAGMPYVHLNCPALLSVPKVKNIPVGRKIQRIGFSIQLPHETGIVNQSCDTKVHRLACQLLLDLAKTHEVELIAHHKSEYFLFLHLLKGTGVPVIYSSFYRDLHDVYRHYDCVVTTRLHSSLYANGHGIPGIIVNDTDRHTHTLSGFPHSVWVNTREAFDREFARLQGLDLARVAGEMRAFKADLSQKYVRALRPAFKALTGTSTDAPKTTLAACLVEALGDVKLKESVLNVMSRLTTDHWLENNKEDYRQSIAAGANWFDTPTFLNWFARNFAPENYLEIGVHRGRSMSQVLTQSPTTNAYGFDMWIANYGSLPEKGILTTNPGPEFVCTELQRLGVRKEPTFIVGNSHDTLRPFFANTANPQEFDLMLVDGDHTDDGARKDLEMAFAHVAPGGAVVFDDTRNIAHPGLQNVWDAIKVSHPEFLFLEDAHRTGTAVALRPPFNHLARSVGIEDSPTEADTYQFDSEKKEQLLVRSLVKPGMTVLDVGAHLGKYTKLFSLLVGQEGRVFSFEPTPFSASNLAGRIESDHLNNVTLLRKAVSDHNGIVTLHQFPEEYSSWNGLGRPSMEDPRDASKIVPILSETEVIATTLDEFCLTQGLTHIDYLKLDVEGAEIHALRGALDLLSRKAIDCLQFEVSRKMLEGLGTSAREVFEFLHEYGYECHSIHKDGKIGPVATDSEAFYDNYVAFPLKVTVLHCPAKNLPISFFTIVLNGQPFIRHHIKTLRQLPFQWHWHIIEGVAELKHDTGWSVATGGRIPDAFHKNGLSIDGTTEYLDELKCTFPDQITIHRPPIGKFWEGKREMVNMPLAGIASETLLWQLDADELWTATQIIRCRALFLAQPEKTAAMFFCNYFVGPDRVITSRDTYGNHSTFEWLRVWRFQPGDRWIAHEPPRLGRTTNDARLVDVGEINPFRHAETESMGLVFQHYAYATEPQVRFKQDYYGYPGAVAQWQKLQDAKTFPCRLTDFFAWVKDAATVNTAASQNIKHLIVLDRQAPAADSTASMPERILFIRTDSIGDAVLASSMLEPIRNKYPDAQLAVLCQQHVAELYVCSPYVNAVICFDRATIETAPGQKEILSDIIQFNPDLILNSVRSRDTLSEAITHAFPRARRIGIESDLNNIAPSDRDTAALKYDQLIPGDAQHNLELAHHAAFLRGLGISVSELKPLVWTSDDDETLAEAFFRQHGLDPLRTIALFPFTQHEVKNFPNFAAALQELIGWNFVIFGGAESETTCELLAKVLPGPCLNLAGRTTLREMAALIRRCRVLFGSDSCGAHIACAMGVPNVVVLGGGHFGRFFPYSPLTSVVALPLDCFDCNWSCSHSRSHCIKDVSPDLLAEAVRQTLAKSSSKPRVFIQAASHWNGGRNLPVWQRPDKFLTGIDAVIIEVASDGMDVNETSVAARSFEIVGEGRIDPLISVIISTYNSEHLLHSCLENLTRQTIFPQIEVIVVDSGSQQNEREIALEFAKKHSNIRYVRTEQETIYGAWNRGLALAHGRYWANLNTDDSLRDDALAILASALENHPDCALAYGDTAWTTKPNDTFPSSHVIRTVKYPNYAPIETLFYCITGCLQFWRTDSIRELGGFDASLRCAGDYEATLKMMAARMNAVHVPEVLSLFFQNPIGLTQNDNRAAIEHDQVTNRYRKTLDVSNIFQIEVDEPSAAANAYAVLGAHAARKFVPWEEKPFEQMDFALTCFHAALDLDPDNLAAGTNLIVISDRLKRLDPNQPELIRRWPKMREWINSFRMGERAHLPPIKHTRLGAVYRPAESSHRPNADQLAREPEALRPWIYRIEGRHIYLSEDLFPRPAGFAFLPEELEAAGNRLVLLLSKLPSFYAHLGGAGDALVLLTSFYDNHPDAVVFSHPNSIGATKALFEAFPKLSKIYFLPQHSEPFFHIILRYAFHELRNCLGAGATPEADYFKEWNKDLNILEKYGVTPMPEWASRFRQNQSNQRIVTLTPKGSLTGMVGSKRNIIDPAIWPQIVQYIQELGYRPVIIGTPDDRSEYPCLDGCEDQRSYSFQSQMEWIGRSAILVGADSWAKTFSALADIPTIVFEPLKGPDWWGRKDPSDFVFLDPWTAITVVKNLEQFKVVFAQRSQTVHSASRESISLSGAKPVRIAWEGSFLDFGSLSHVNRALTTELERLPELNLTCIEKSKTSKETDPALKPFTSRLKSQAPHNVQVTVRHGWPPKWNAPSSGSLVLIQPWEYGALPKEWVAKAAQVREFWVPSEYVRRVYVNSGMPAGKVRVVPNGIDPQVFFPEAIPLPLDTVKKYKFLFVGGTIHRKGPDVLLRAFLESFTAADDVCLVIKDFGGKNVYAGQTMESEILAARARPDAPEILYLTGEIDPRQIGGLYTACDCLVHPYRGEGFGLPVLEAMACGLPVVVTTGGAADDFATDDYAYKIPARRYAIGSTVGGMTLAREGWLLEPDPGALGKQMRWLFENRREAKEKGGCATSHVREFWTWERAAYKAANALREIVESAEAEAKALAARREFQIEIPSIARLGSLLEPREFLVQQHYAEAWQRVLRALDRRPFHPEAFLLLAEISLVAGDSQNARRCAQYARELAPKWKNAKQFLQRPMRGETRPDWLQLPGGPRPSFQLTVCVIAKNEEKNLGRCVESIRSLARQIIVVDTGSTDRTVAIAKQYDAEVYHFDWCDDFSAARNEALKYCTGDWILMLDADEELPPDQHAKLRSELQNPKIIGYRLPLVNAGQNDGHHYVPRLFRNAPGVYFYGRIHEQAFPSLLTLGKTWGLETALGTSEIVHYGYTKEVEQQKVERNLGLLRLANEENPGDANLVMNFGLELVRSGDLYGGIEKYGEAFRLMSAQKSADIVPELRETLLTQISTHLTKAKQTGEVIRILNGPLAKNGGLTASLHFTLGLACFELENYREAAEQFRLCLEKRHLPALCPINIDIRSSGPRHCLALSLARLGDVSEAEKSFQIALSEPGRVEDVKLDYGRFLRAQNRSVEALQQLHEIVSQNPRNTFAWRIGGEIALSQPEFLEFAGDWSVEAVRNLPHDLAVLSLRAEILLLQSNPGAALEYWNRVYINDANPRTFAALIICEIVESKLRRSKIANEPAVSREFLSWYRKLLTPRTQNLIGRLNEGMNVVGSILPSAALVLEKTLHEVEGSAPSEDLVSAF